MITARQFLLWLLLFLAVALAAVWFGYLYIQAAPIQARTISLIGVVYAAGLTWLAFVLNNRALTRNPRQFTTAILSASLLKLFLSIAFVGIMALTNIEYAIPFVVCYFSAYLLFTVFEVWTLLHNLRAVSKKPRFPAS